METKAVYILDATPGIQQFFFNREMSSLIEILDVLAEHVTGNTVEINGAFPRLESFVSSLV